MMGVNDNGTHWTYFTKIVAAPAYATLDNGIYYLQMEQKSDQNYGEILPQSKK
jgi:hypothetical protein